MASPNLSITHVAASQNQKEVTINDAIDRLDLAVTDTATYDMASGNATVTAAEFRENVYFAPQAALTAPRTLTVPSGIKRLFVAGNGNTAAGNTLTVACGATSVVIPGGERRLLYTDGTTIRSIGGGGALANLTDVAIANPALNDVLRWNGSEWSNGAGGGSGSGSNWAVPFKGAALVRTADLALSAATPTAVAWQAEGEDTDGFADLVANAGRLTIPAGITRVRLRAQIDLDVASGNVSVSIRKNGVTDATSAYQQVGKSDYTYTVVNLATRALAVAASDYFEVVVETSAASTVKAARSWFALEVVETTAAIGPVVQGVTIPFKGALVTMAANYTHAGGSAFVALPFDTETYDTGGFHDPLTNNSRLTVPAGVAKVRLLGAAYIAPTVSGSYQSLHIRRNGTGYVGPARVLDYESSSNSKGLQIVTPVVAVAPGDYFELVWYSNDGGPIEADKTFFAIEVVETTDALAPPHDISGFHNGVPGSAATLLRYVFPRTVQLPANLAGSQASAAVAATGSATCSIQRNGVEVGTMAFAAAAMTATFTMASTTTFAAGEILTVIAPATPDGTLADIAFTLAGIRA